MTDYTMLIQKGNILKLYLTRHKSNPQFCKAKCRQRWVSPKLEAVAEKASNCSPLDFGECKICRDVTNFVYFCRLGYKFQDLLEI